MEHTLKECICEGRECLKCHVVWCVGNYTKDKRLKSGLKSRCVICSREDNKGWRENNKEHNQRRAKIYYKTEKGLETRKKNNLRRRTDQRYVERRNLLDRERRRKVREANPLISRKVDIEKSFFSKFEMLSLFDCWTWTGGLKPNGYGVFIVNRRPLYAHRWSYEYHNGVIPQNMVIDHICRNKQCVNPSHLRAVTQKENIAYHLDSLTHCVKGHPREKGLRRCRECVRITNNKRRRRGISNPPIFRKRYSKKEWEDLKAYYQNKCLRCGRDDIKLTADHVIPLKERGASTIDNIQPLCMKCNIWKRAKTIDFRNQNP